MEVVGIKELKDHLSRYLRGVKAGEELLVSERGRVVARIIPAGDVESEEVARLYDLARRGLVRLPEAPLEPGHPDKLEIRGKPLSETVIEDRRGFCIATPAPWSNGTFGRLTRINSGAFGLEPTDTHVRRSPIQRQ